MRDNSFLRERLYLIWQKNFSDIKKANRVCIQFGPKARKRLGSIRRCNFQENGFDTKILINGHFKDKTIPTFIIDATIAHELAHYCHGVASPLPQLSRFAHRGGIVDIELEKRGLGKLVDTEHDWMQKKWLKYLKSK